MPFRSEDHLDRWLSQSGLTAGYHMSIQRCWQLAQRWYTGRGERDWQRPDQRQTQQLFDDLGLMGPFWNLGGTTD